MILSPVRPLLLSAICVVGLLDGTPSAAADAAAHLAALRSITVDDLGRHVDFLADDGLEGREAGSRGGYAAADYLRRQCEALRLSPAGTSGYYQPFAPNYRNIVAAIEGSDAALKRQFVLVGAHYDHVGYGNPRNSFGPHGQVHNGADDNASGVAGVLETAQAITLLGEAPRRSIVFAFWDGEEKGLLGSRHFAAQPTVAAGALVFALHVDMIGRAQDDRVYVFGARTAPGLRRLVSEQNQSTTLGLEFVWWARPHADHFPFFERGIPVLLFHTGEHEDYHRPSDDASRLNRPALARVSQLFFETVLRLANADELPAFREAARRDPTEKQEKPPELPPPPRLGISWQEPVGREGVVVTAVVPGSPAEAAGIRPADRIVRLGDRPVASTAQLLAEVRTAEAKLPLSVLSPGQAEPRRLDVPLAGRPMRFGISWLSDEAEPGTVIVVHVAAGSPAAAAGLQPGDRLYQVGGQPITSEAALAERLAAATDPLELLVERRGTIRQVKARLAPARSS